MSHSVKLFVARTTILTHSVIFFVTMITDLSQTAKKFVRRSTNLYHSTEMFVARFTSLSHSVKKFVGWVSILSHSAQKKRCGNHKFFKRSQTFRKLQQNILSKCQKIWYPHYNIVSFSRKFSELIQTFVSRCWNFRDENDNFSRDVEIFLSWINVLYHSTVFFAARITFMSNSVIIFLGCTTILSQLQKNWIESHVFAWKGQNFCEFSLKYCLTLSKTLRGELQIYITVSKSFWGELRFCRTIPHKLWREWQFCVIVSMFLWRKTQLRRIALKSYRDEVQFCPTFQKKWRINHKFFSRRQKNSEVQ